MSSQPPSEIKEDLDCPSALQTAPQLVRVLLVDDDEEEALILRSLLRESAALSGALRYELEAETSVHAAQRIIECAEHDVYLIDYRLGPHTGLELIERAVANGCEAPLILLSGQDDPRVDAEAMRAGATDYLVKDELTGPLLERALRYALAGKRSERELRRIAEQNARLQAAIEAASVGVALTELVDGENLICYVNPAFTSITGYEKERVVGQTLWFLQGRETAPEAVEILRSAFHDNREVQLTVRNYRADGSAFWNEVLVGPIRDEGGSCIGHAGFLQDVSARVEAQVAAREARGNLEMAQALTHLGSWSYSLQTNGDYSTRSGFWSDETYRILGLQPGEVDLSRVSWLDYVHPDDRQSVLARRERAQKEEVSPVFECRIVGADGVARYVQIRSQTRRDAAGRAIGAAGTILDITERKRAEIAERELESRLRTVTENVPIILWALDMEGRFTLSEGSTLRKLGIEPGEMVGRSVFDEFADAPDVVKMCRAALRGEKKDVVLSAQAQTYSVSVAPQWNARGEQIGVAGVSYDITEKARAQDALRESEARFERIASNVPGMVYRLLVDPDGENRFVYLSQGCRDIFGISPEEAMRDSRVLERSIAAEDWEQVGQSAKIAIQDLQSWRMEFNIARLDGERRRVRGQFKPTRQEDGTVICDGILIDLTESQLTQQALEQSRRSLAEAQRLAHLGSFSWNARNGEVIWSDEMYRLFGVRPGEFTPSIDSITERIHDTDREQAKQLTRELMAGNAEEQGLRLITRADGALRYVETRSHIERDENGEVSFIVGSAQDLTEKIEAQRALHQSEERYALAARGTNDGLWDWSLASDRIYYSPRWKNMIGCEENEISDMPDEWFSRVHREDIEHLHAVLHMHLRGGSPHFECEYRLRDSKGNYRWMQGRGLALFDSEGRATRLTGSQTDIADRKHAEGQLERNAYYDALTGLPNRALFSDRLSRTIRRGNRDADLTFAVLFLDIDRFKKINDSLGHLTGDQLLIEASQRFAQCLRPGDTVSRLGGDEFAILLDDLSGIEDVHQVAGRIHDEMRAPFDLDGHEAFVTVSIGIALGQGGDQDAQELLRGADTAMYRAKGAGRGHHQVFEAGMHQRAVHMLELETDLWRALERRELRLYYQPIIALESGAIQGFEALVRWQHPERGLVSPGDFIPLAEENGLIVPIGWWVLEEACRQAQLWQNRFSQSALFMSVNLSSRQITQTDMMARVTGALERTEFDAGLLKLEITESAIMENTEAAAEILSQVKTLRVGFAMDDFGTGYSSLSYLHRFPLDVIKIDRSFVSQMTPQARDREIVNTIVSMAHGLKLSVVAEGVETVEQLQELRKMRCEFAQGFYVSRPLPADQIEQLLSQDARW